MAKNDTNSFINSDEAARLLGIRKSYLYKLTHQRKIPCYKPRGGVLLFDAQELDEYVRTGRVKPQKELAALAEIGGLWLSSSTNPKAPFAKGEIEVDGKKIRIVVWKNHYKQDGDKKPDYQIEIDRREPGMVADPPKAEFTDDIPFWC